MAIVAPIVSTFDNKGVRRARDAFGGLARGLGGVFKGIAVGFAGISTAGAFGIAKAVGAASDLGEAISANEQIFGSAADEILRFAEGAASTIGQSTQTVLEGAQTFGTFGKAAGLADSDLSAFAIRFGTLASDLGSFYNADPAAVIEALGAGLRGESEPLRRFGVLLNDATLKQQALELGIYDGNGALTDQQKILAAEAAIFAQTTDAQGDFARTSGSLANQQRILRARLDNVVAQLGRKFLPIAERLATFVLDKVVPAIERLVEIFDRDGLGGVIRFARDEIRKALPGVIAQLRELGGQLVAWISPQIGPALAALGRWAGRVFAWVRDTALPFLLERLRALGEALVAWIGPRIGPAVDQLREWAARLGQWLVEVAVPFLVDKAIQLGDALVAWIGPRIGPAVEQLREWANTIATWILDVGLPLLVDKAIQLGDALVEWVRPMIRPTLERLGEWLAQLGVWIITVAVPKLLVLAAKLLAAMIRWTVTLSIELFKGIRDAFTTSQDWMFSEGVALIGDALDRLVAKIREKLAEAASAALDFGKNIGSAIVDGIVDAIITAASKIRQAVLDIIPGGPGVVSAVTSIIPFANGGIVTGPTLGLVGEAGPEAIIPLDRLGQYGGGGTTIVNVSGALDPAAVAQQIRDLLNNDARRRGLVA